MPPKGDPDASAPPSDLADSPADTCPGASRFQPVRRLGEGGMGVVWLVRERASGKMLALKTLHAHDPQALYRLKSEFRALADMAHPNLIALGELVREGARWYFTMEAVDGPDLLDWVRPPERARAVAAARGAGASGGATGGTAGGGPAGGAEAAFHEARLRAVLPEVVRGLMALHAAGMVHRDVKPSNILVERKTGRAVVLDFGLVADVGSGRGMTEHRLAGTPEYMAPEQARGKDVGPPVDWYALGCMLYEALTGDAPVLGEPVEILVAKQTLVPEPPSRRARGVPADLESLCLDLLRIDPAARPGGREILERLGAGAEGPAGSGSASGSVGASLGQSPAEGAAGLGADARPPFFGRAAELASLRESLGRVQGAREGAIVFVRGESGLGKSALVRRFLDGLEGVDGDGAGAGGHAGAGSAGAGSAGAGSAGAGHSGEGDTSPAGAAPPLVLAGRCYERESVPFKAFDGLVDALTRHLSGLDAVEAAWLLPRDLGPLARVFPVLRRVPALAKVVAPDTGARAQVDPQELRARAFAALRELLARLGERRTTVLFVDDFHWADPDSLALFGEVFPPAGAPPLLLLATMRSGTAFTPPGHARTIDLAPLAAADARALAASILGGADGGAAETQRLAATDTATRADAVTSEAGGHPLFLLELARHVAAGGGAHVRLDDALGSRVQALPPDARRALELTALAGVPLAQRVIAAASGLRPEPFSAAVSTLRAARLARTSGARPSDTIEPYHDRIRETVAASLDDATRRRSHLSLADALEAAGGADLDPLVPLRHLEAAGERARAATHALTAARRLTGSLAFDRAAELFEAALRLGEHGPEERRALTLERAEALVGAGRAPEAANVLLSVAGDLAPEARLTAKRRAAELLLASGHIERGLATIGDVLAAHGDRLPATPVRALVSLLWTRLKLRLRGLRFRDAAEADVPAALLARIDAFRSVAIGLGHVDLLKAAVFQARGLLLALRAGEPRRIGRNLALDAIFMSTEGRPRLERTSRMADVAAEIAARTGDPYLDAWVPSARGCIAYYAGGRFQEAATRLAEAEAIFRDRTTGSFWELSNTRVFRLLALRIMGHMKDMQRDVPAYLRDADRRGDRFLATTLVRLFNATWLAGDRADEAAAGLAERTWPDLAGVFHTQHWYLLWGEAELQLYRGSVDAAVLASFRPRFAALGRSLLWRLQLVRGESAWLRGRLALAAAVSLGKGKDAEPLALASAMARRLSREGTAACTAWGTLLEAGIAARGPSRDAARERFTIAAERSEAAEMALCAAAARRRAGELAGGDAGKALIERADRFMREQEIKNPARMTELTAPGV